MNPSTDLARALLDELVHQGVREVVLSPGSRCAPLAFAAARLAEAGRLRLHVRVDERSAGFLALGLAAVSGDPVAVMCTSGTALANLTPAVVEASYRAVPLVVVSADRPPEARGVGAPQTIDQVRFFGDMVRSFADVGAPRRADSGDPGGVARAARAAVGIAVCAAMGTSDIHAGPVHLNVAFRLPLVPEADDAQWRDADADGRAAEVARGHATPPRTRRPPLAGCDHHDLAEALGGLPERGVLLVGDLPSSALRGHQQWLATLAHECGWPIIVEPTANLHGAANALGHGVLVLGSEGFLSANRPELVVTAGLFGLSRPTMDLLRSADRHVAIELPGVGREVCDPLRSASTVLRGIPLSPAEGLAASVGSGGWLATWLTADAVAADVVTTHLAAHADRFTATAVARHLWTRLPDDALLLVAASWSVRQVEAVGGRRRGLTTVGNRGANGIDGLVSTAWGAALAHQQRGGGPAAALLGDLALLHDHNGLLAGPSESRPDLVLVVADNDGGGIFHQLEQGRPEHAQQFERLFGTPVSRDLVAVAQAAGVPAARVTSGSELAAALDDALARGGVRVVVADVPDRAGEARQLDELRALVDARLRARV